MAKRKSTFRVDAKDDARLRELQGDDAFVTFRRMTYGAISDLSKEQRTRKDKGGSKPEENDAENQSLLVAYVVDWNLADDAGNPLPLPSAGLKVGDLVNAEVDWLISNIINAAVPPKN